MSRSVVKEPQSNSQYPMNPEQSEAEVSLQRQVAKEFSRAVLCAQRAADREDPELAVGWCRYAAALAWGMNPGLFYSHKLEQLLMSIGRRQLGSIPPQFPTSGSPLRFLHVISTVFETGGHTRAASCWIRTSFKHASLECHSILITMQNDEPLPPWLSDSVERTGGEVIQLPSGLSWLQAAAEIRFKSMQFDAIVLHIHPHDPLPNLAFHDQARPVLFFRHSDHVFNLGLDVARVIADIRPVGREMSIHFGPNEPQKVMLPLPLFDEVLFSCDKTNARKKLGLPADALVILTIGWPVKFVPMEGYSFAAVVRSLCEANPRVHIVAVGLTESEPFPGLAQSMGGRFQPVGVVEAREILELYYCAADIYLDAYPCSSGTAVLDAARHGLPVQRLYNRHRCLLWGDDPGLDSVMRAATTQDEFIATVLDWLEWSEEKRNELGHRFRNAVLPDHCGASWKSKWLDPAIEALISPGENLLDSMPNCSKRNESDFPGLGLVGAESDWPPGMFVAGAILSTDDVPRPIRIHGVFRSIRPALFSAASDGDRRIRILMFGVLFSSFMPNPIRMIVRWTWRTFFQKP